MLRVIRRLLTVGVWGFVVYLAFDFYGMIGTVDFDGDTVTGSAALFALGLTVVAALLAIWLINWIFADKDSPTND
jgi:hypothetical protein